MIYLVSARRKLFKDNRYEVVNPDIAINILKDKKRLGADTETEGLDFLTKKLLTIQLGTKDDQVVWDCTTIDPNPLRLILEDPNILTIWWNFLSNQAA